MRLGAGGGVAGWQQSWQEPTANVTGGGGPTAEAAGVGRSKRFAAAELGRDGGAAIL